LPMGDHGNTQRFTIVLNIAIWYWDIGPEVNINALEGFQLDVLSTILIITGLLVSIVGFVGCLLPIVPGPPLSFLALLILSLAGDWEPFTAWFLILMGVLAGLVTLLDYVLPAAGARKYGASRYGVWGCLAGLILGLIIFSVIGMFIGGLAGAVIGELLAGKKRGDALRAGWGVFVGNVLGAGVKLALSGVMLFFYIRGMF